MQERFTQETRKGWALLRRAVTVFLRIDGTEWAGAFAYNAFFALLPTMVMLVTIASFFIDREQAAGRVITYIESYVPISGEMQSYIFNTIGDAISARGRAGALALLILAWAALQCITTLISAIDRAWGGEAHSWWRLPMKSLMLLGIMAGAVLLGMAAPVLVTFVKDHYFPVRDFRSWVYALGSFVIPLLVEFLSLGLLYKLAPRRPMRYADVWAAALGATVLLQAAAGLFVIYLKNFATLNVMYGAFGGIMALLLWIYLSGCIVIFGACLCAARTEGPPAPGETITAR